MLYYSERNHGCRFLEVAILGYRAIILENEKIRTTILLDKGTEIIEFNQKETDTDFLWRSPLGLSCLRKIMFTRGDGQILTNGYTGGWFEAFPNTGESCLYKGAQIPHYGEVCYLPWEYAVVKDDPAEVALKCFVRTTKTPYFVEKTFSVRSGTPALFIEESVQNLGRETLHYQWGHHPNFGPPFIGEHCSLDMPGGEITVEFAAPGSRLSRGASGSWPFVEGRDGAVIDLRAVPPGGSGVCEEIAVNGLKDGWIRVANRERKAGIQLDWDVRCFPHSLIWLVCNGDTGYPRYGATHVLGFLPRTDRVRGLADAARMDQCPTIGPNETRAFWLTATAFNL